MYAYEADLAKLTVADRIREAQQRKLGRDLRRDQQRAAVAAAVPAPRHTARLWRLAHLRHAYS